MIPYGLEQVTGLDVRGIDVGVELFLFVRMTGH